MNKTSSTRTENDSLGEVKIKENAYYGAVTARALKNFQISGVTAERNFIKALGLIKQAAAEVNGSLKLLTKEQTKAILQACKEFIAGKFYNEFLIDVFQAGAGTSYNMNANEVIANRANEILLGKKGQYKYVHPNNHVNMAQSTNDVIPTAARLAILFALPNLLSEIKLLENEISKIAKKYKNLVKVGRTHLQDAVPITLGQEFDSYKEAIKKSRKIIEQQSHDLKILGIGGTAIGTGINTHQKYKMMMIKTLSKLTKINFRPTANMTETTNNMNSFLNFSATLRSLSVNLLNFCGDLKLMNMGPKAGIGEITLPPVQPGSSIMPGKVNPSIPECMEMICMQVIGNDRTIEIAAQKSQLEINVYCPIIMYNLLQSIQILTNGLKTLRELCIKGIKINDEKIKSLFSSSLCTATALAPSLGYQLVAEIVKSALEKNTTIKDEVLKRKLLDKRELDKVLSETAAPY
ncbi:MAG: aspartate ammonia-lyase [Patescibacteria group bacterium]